MAHLLLTQDVLLDFSSKRSHSKVTKSARKIVRYKNSAELKAAATFDATGLDTPHVDFIRAAIRIIAYNRGFFGAPSGFAFVSNGRVQLYLERQGVGPDARSLIEATQFDIDAVAAQCKYHDSWWYKYGDIACVLAVPVLVLVFAIVMALLLAIGDLYMCGFLGCNHARAAGLFANGGGGV